MTPEEKRARAALERMPIANYASDEVWLSVVIPIIAAEIRAAVAEEREACQKAVCYGCRHHLEYVDGKHKMKDGLVPRGEDFRWVNCNALMIRARGRSQ